MTELQTALLIDLDGTLVDTVADLAAALNALRAEYGRAPLADAQVRALVGRGARRLVERGLADTVGRDAAGLNGARLDTARLDAEPLEAVSLEAVSLEAVSLEAASLEAAVARFLTLYAAAPAVRSRPYPGVRATLNRWAAAGVPMAVCTNKPQAHSLSVLRALGLGGYFRAVGGGDRYPVRKPDGRHLTATLADAGLTGRPAVMIGDSAPDLEAARDAGLPVVLVAYGYSDRPVDTLGADAVVPRFDRVPAAVRHVAGPSTAAPGAAVPGAVPP